MIISRRTREHIRTTFTAGIIGNVMEWYDFSLIAYFIPILSTLFFPSEDPLASLLAAFGVFAAGYIIRSLGSVMFGYIGDIWGRRRVLVLSVILMGIPTFFLGTLPTYAQVGIIAPILLFVLRLIQGLSVSGEFTGSVTYLVETCPQDKRGLSGCFANIGTIGGFILGSGAAALVTTLLPESAAYSWGWRVPFLCGGAIAILAIYMLRTLAPSKIFEERKTTDRSPIKLALTKNRRQCLQAFTFTAGWSVCLYVPCAFLPVYISEITNALPLGRALQITSIGLFLLMLFIPVMGFISDRYIRRKRFLLITFGTIAVLSYPLFRTFDISNVALILIGETIFFLLISVPLGVSPTTLAELFPTEDRVSGYSISFNIAMGTGGGTAPVIATWLISAIGNIFAPAFYVVLCALIAIAGLSTMVDISREPLK